MPYVLVHSATTISFSVLDFNLKTMVIDKDKGFNEIWTLSKSWNSEWVDLRAWYLKQNSVVVESNLNQADFLELFLKSI